MLVVDLKEVGVVEKGQIRRSGKMGGAGTRAILDCMRKCSA